MSIHNNELNVVHIQKKLRSEPSLSQLQDNIVREMDYAVCRSCTLVGVFGERCLRPLQLALESKNRKLAQTALTGMQMLSEDRFVSLETEALERQLLSQMLDAVRVTPMLHEDLQVEVMKVRPFCTYGLLKRSLL
ncbi:brefeldin A-inhibited guanine nucleotide-exchange protein 3-like isoform X2 [Salvelinus sp. IW2-2015]|uniref:brefeldin A-inhibited guanine nucleotide-exchange protein 3-like isoform X2 n=1 Tax=Salvelinus sp. IW2-2015 TaxID=2691554 RepID=UPI000CDF995B|nr:brefeldin A-inhibited guanine nucleotide-exchange protein 3-like isoform X2 [Salvelinus alpinus]